MDIQKPEVERTIEIPAEPETVWERIADGELSEEWMGVRIDPRPGGKVDVQGRDMLATVEEVQPGHSITWTWRERDGEPSQVTIRVEPSEIGSVVTVTERLLDYRITGSPPVFLSMAA
jgi:uncharacterized protein YndB with AHSA1/START domain